MGHAELEDLYRRLQKTRWSRGWGDGGWEFGTSPAYLKELVAYWLTGFDWRKQETSLNEFPHFKADVDDGRVHARHEPALARRLPHDAVSKVCGKRTIGDADLFEANARLEIVKEAYASAEKVGRDVHENLVDEPCSKRRLSG